MADYAVLLLFVISVISDIEDMRHILLLFFMIVHTITYICANFGFAWLWYLEMALPNVTDDPNAAQFHFLFLFSHVKLDWRCIFACNCLYSLVKWVARLGVCAGCGKVFIGEIS